MTKKAPPLPGEEMTNGSCRLVGGTFSDCVQLVLFVISFSSLVYKRSIERPQRPLQIWALDSLKQGFSSNLVHFWNILASILMASNGIIMTRIRTVQGTSRVSEKGFDECAFYFCSFFVDTTVGCVITYYALQFTIWIADKDWVWRSWHTPGKYGRPPNYTIWWQQMVQWVLCTLVMKGLITALLVLFENEWGIIGNFIFKPLQIFPKLELVLVMLIGPACMNAFQFWVQDSFLMHRDGNGDGDVDCDGDGDGNDVNKNDFLQGKGGCGDEETPLVSRTNNVAVETIGTTTSSARGIAKSYRAVKIG